MMENQIPEFDSLDSVFENLSDDGFEDNLNNYLDKMPRSRDAAEEILDAIKQWDVPELYSALLQDYVEYLTQDEISGTVAAFKEKFDMPLSFIADESILDAGE